MATKFIALIKNIKYFLQLQKKSLARLEINTPTPAYANETVGGMVTRNFPKNIGARAPNIKGRSVQP